MSNATFGVASTIMAAFAFILYFRSILKYEQGSQPSRMTWLLLATISWVVVANSYVVDASDTLGPLLMNALGSTMVFILALRYGVGGWSAVDKIALIGAIIVFSLSLYMDRPLISLVLALSFDFFALLPTLLKLYQRPAMEEALPWVLTVSSNLLNVLALGVLQGHQNTIEIALPPWYFLIINGAVLLLILFPRKT